MNFNIRFFAYLAVFLTVGCDPSGPSYEERQQLQEQERQERISQAHAELDAFAKRYDARPIDFFGYSNSLRSKFTAAIQQELEGKIVAFRGTLLDVRRSSLGAYEVVFGEKYFSTTTLHLSLAPDVAKDILSRTERFESDVFVVARVERIVRHQVSARVCGEPDCNTISIDVDSVIPSFQIWGEMIDLNVQ